MSQAISIAESEKAKFITQTYIWMGAALLVSALSAFYTSTKIFNGSVLTPFGQFLYGPGISGVWLFAIAEIAIVIALSAMIRKISLQGAIIGFFAYSVLNGVTLSSILLIYQIESIAVAFLGTSAMFFIMALYGSTTKKNLSTFGRYLMMALIGIIVVSLLEFIMYAVFHLDTTLLDWLISIASVIVFTGLTAFDAQKIVKVAEHSNGSDDYKKVSLMAALELYLDFINLFLTLLRIFGKRK